MQGLEFSMEENLDVDYCYLIPRLRYWFIESDLYPYIGGNQVEKATRNGSLLPSINLIFPYVSPAFIREGTNDALYVFSETCLDNVYDLRKYLS